MADKAQLLAEAYRRGLLPPDKAAAYEEAMRRGLVQGVAGAIPKPKRSLMQDVTGAMANVNRGLGIGDEMAAGLATAGNVLRGRVQGETPGGFVNALARDFRGSMADQRQIEDGFASARPNASALALGTGNALTAFAPGGRTMNALAAAPRAVNAARGATTAALGAAGFGLVDRGSAQERARIATDPGTLLVSGALGGGIGALAPAARRVKPAKVTARDRDVALLANEGVQLTPGQIRGGMMKTAEDAGTALPFLGDSISARRTDGVETFNRATVNRALRQVGAELPDDVATGTDAVKYAGDLISKGYEDIIPERLVRADPGFADDARAALANIETLTPQSQKRLATILDQRVTSQLGENGTLDGPTYKRVQSQLDFEVSRFRGANDPDQRAMGDAIEGVQKALEAAAMRQDPAFATRVQSLDRAWAELARIEAAATKATDMSGVFTPKQYSASIRAGDDRVRRRGVARGEALNQDLAGAAARVLPSQVGDSGTATRSAWGMVAAAPGAVMGAVTGGGLGALAGIAGTGATLASLSKLYTPEAVRAANAAMSSRASSQAQQEALEELRRIAMQTPAARDLYSKVISRVGRTAGAAAGASRAPAVEVEIPARPELGRGVSYGPGA